MHFEIQKITLNNKIWAFKQTINHLWELFTMQILIVLILSSLVKSSVEESGQLWDYDYNFLRFNDKWTKLKIQYLN